MMMMKTKTTEEFIKEVYDSRGDEYTVLGEYINNTTKIKIRHNKCKYEYGVRPNSFLSGARCPECFGVVKKDTEWFKDDVYVLVGDEYTVLGEYINDATKIRMMHNKCKSPFHVRPANFLRNGSRCPCCRTRTKKNKTS